MTKHILREVQYKNDRFTRSDSFIEVDVSFFQRRGRGACGEVFKLNDPGYTDSDKFLFKKVAKYTSYADHLQHVMIELLMWNRFYTDPDFQMKCFELSHPLDSAADPVVYLRMPDFGAKDAQKIGSIGRSPDESTRIRFFSLAVSALENVTTLINRGLCHLDVKLQNFIQRGDRLFLIDFGATYSQNYLPSQRVKTTTRWSKPIWYRWGEFYPEDLDMKRPSKTGFGQKKVYWTKRQLHGVSTDLFAVGMTILSLYGFNQSSIDWYLKQQKLKAKERGIEYSKRIELKTKTMAKYDDYVKKYSAYVANLLPSDLSDMEKTSFAEFLCSLVPSEHSGQMDVGTFLVKVRYFKEIVGRIHARIDASSVETTESVEVGPAKTGAGAGAEAGAGAGATSATIKSPSSSTIVVKRVYDLEDEVKESPDIIMPAYAVTKKRDFVLASASCPALGERDNLLDATP